MDTIHLLVNIIAVVFGGYIFSVYLCRAFKGKPMASKGKGKFHFALDLTIVTLVFFTYFLGMLVEALEALNNFLGV